MLRAFGDVSRVFLVTFVLAFAGRRGRDDPVADLARARRFRPGPRLVSVLVGGAAAILVLYPIAYLIQASLSVGDPQARPPEAYGLDNFADLPRYGHIFANTVTVAVAATVMAVVVGFVMGWILSRTNVPGRAAFEQLMAMPYYVTPLLGALAWGLIGSPNSGVSTETKNW